MHATRSTLIPTDSCNRPASRGRKAIASLLVALGITASLLASSPKAEAATSTQGVVTACFVTNFGAIGGPASGFTARLQYWNGSQWVNWQNQVLPSNGCAYFSASSGWSYRASVFQTTRGSYGLVTFAGTSAWGTLTAGQTRVVNPNGTYTPYASSSSWLALPTTWVSCSSCH